MWVQIVAIHSAGPRPAWINLEHLQTIAKVDHVDDRYFLTFRDGMSLSVEDPATVTALLELAQ